MVGDNINYLINIFMRFINNSREISKMEKKMMNKLDFMILKKNKQLLYFIYLSHNVLMIN